MSLNRVERLQIMLTEDELTVIDDWRFERQMPAARRPFANCFNAGWPATDLPWPTEACSQKTLESVSKQRSSQGIGAERRNVPKTRSRLPRSSTTG